MRRFTAAVAVAAFGLMAAACSPPAEEGENGNGGDDSQAQGPQAGTSVTVGWNQPFYSYNDATSNGNATANANVKYLMNSGFSYYNPDQELVQDTSFGTYEKTSDDPLTVTYTINDDVTWSDGTPVDAADLLLVWAAGSGNLNTVDADKVERNPDTNVPVEGQGVYFDTSAAGLPFVTQTPEIDGKSMTLVYDEPFADWEVEMGLNAITVPAHVTAGEALGIDDPQEAKDALIKAVQDKDEEALSKIANFWNSGYDYSSLPDNDKLYLSNGAYLMKDFVENQYMTLEANPDYKGDRQAVFETLTIRWNEDPLAQAQSLANGEIDMFAPQATTDVLDAVEAIDGVEVSAGVEGTYEHVDLVFNNGGPFDPKSYGGDEEKANLVRQAFLHAVPRQEIVDKLVKPLNPEATVRNSFLVTEGAPGYDEIVAENGSSEFAEADVAKSKQLLQEAGVKTPIDVRMMFAEGNVRRENEFALMQPALKEAGFNLIDRRNVDWGSKLGDGTYDAVFFGWQSTSTAVSGNQETFKTGGLNNLIGYSNPEVDKLFRELVLTTDEAQQIELQLEIEKLLFEDAIGITLFQFPGVAAWNTARVENVQPAPLAPTIFYGFWEWQVPS